MYNMEKTFTVTCTMEERWIDTFMSMLNKMESDGKLGHSEIIGFYSDGDGDFRPEFKSDIDWNKVEGIDTERPTLSRLGILYDAG